MKKKYRLLNSTEIEIEAKPIASGGEGDIFRITAPQEWKGQIAKLFFSGKATELKQKKLEFMIEHAPHFSQQSGHQSVIWPTQLIQDANGFVGYTMPFATGIKLELLCHPNKPKALNKEWDKYSFDHPLSIQLRKKLCYNIAVAVSHIHESGNYVLVDLKPDNIMIKPDGLIALIDVDSTEIIEDKSVLFPAHVATPEYTPPEFYSHINDIQTQFVPETWDRFALAVLFYRILLGIHPFTGALKPPYEALTNISEIIERGFFIQGNHRNKFKIIPPPHRAFTLLDEDIKQLFFQALDITVHPPEFRPSATDWCKVLSPNPGQHLNRMLPSQTKEYGKPSYTERIQFEQINRITLHKPGFLQEPVYNGIWSKVKGKLFKTKRDELFEAIKRFQQEIERAEFEIYQKTDWNKQQLAEIGKKQGMILIHEKQQIDALIQQFLVKLNEMDRIAKNLFEKETDELERILHANESVFSLQKDKTEEQERIRKQYNGLHEKLIADLDVLEQQLQQQMEQIHEKSRTLLFNLYSDHKHVISKHQELIEQKKGQFDLSVKKLLGMMNEYLTQG